MTWPTSFAPSSPQRAVDQAAHALEQGFRSDHSRQSRAAKARLRITSINSRFASPSVACKPRMAPRTSARDRFCPSFALPSIRAMRMSKHMTPVQQCPKGVGR